MPALLISTSMRPKRDTAASTTLSAVFGSPISPLINARFADRGKEFAFAIFREFAPTLYPRFKTSSSSAAPIPWEAPVTIAVFCASVIFAFLFTVQTKSKSEALAEGIVWRIVDVAREPPLTDIKPPRSVDIVHKQGMTSIENIGVPTFLPPLCTEDYAALANRCFDLPPVLSGK